MISGTRDLYQRPGPTDEAREEHCRLLQASLRRVLFLGFWGSVKWMESACRKSYRVSHE